jgi:hypothetical protein
LNSFEDNVGSPAPKSDSLNCDTISRLSMKEDAVGHDANREGTNVTHRWKTRVRHRQSSHSQRAHQHPLHQPESAHRCLTIISVSTSSAPSHKINHVLRFVCCPHLTIFVPVRHAQHTSALSAPAETRCFDESATARIPYKCLIEALASVTDS